MDTENLLTIPDAALMAKVKPATVRKWILQNRRGLAKIAIRVGDTSLRFRRSDWQAWLDGSPSVEATDVSKV